MNRIDLKTFTKKVIEYEKAKSRLQKQFEENNINKKIREENLIETYKPITNKLNEVSNVIQVVYKTRVLPHIF